jgi:hypothetical protein
MLRRGAGLLSSRLPRQHINLHHAHPSQRASLTSPAEDTQASQARSSSAARSVGHWLRRVVPVCVSEEDGSASWTRWIAATALRASSGGAARKSIASRWEEREREGGSGEWALWDAGVALRMSARLGGASSAADAGTVRMVRSVTLSADRARLSLEAVRERRLRRAQGGAEDESRLASGAVAAAGCGALHALFGSAVHALDGLAALPSVTPEVAAAYKSVDRMCVLALQESVDSGVVQSAARAWLEERDEVARDALDGATTAILQCVESATAADLASEGLIRALGSFLSARVPLRRAPSASEGWEEEDGDGDGEEGVGRSTAVATALALTTLTRSMRVLCLWREWTPAPWAAVVVASQRILGASDSSRVVTRFEQERSAAQYQHTPVAGLQKQDPDAALRRAERMFRGRPDVFRTPAEGGEEEDVDFDDSQPLAPTAETAQIHAASIAELLSSDDLLARALQVAASAGARSGATQRTSPLAAPTPAPALPADGDDADVQDGEEEEGEDGEGDGEKDGEKDGEEIGERGGELEPSPWLEASFARLYVVMASLERLSTIPGAARALGEVAWHKYCALCYERRSSGADRATREESVAVRRNGLDRLGLVQPASSFPVAGRGLRVAFAWPSERVALDLDRREDRLRPVDPRGDVGWTDAVRKGRLVLDGGKRGVWADRRTEGLRLVAADPSSAPRPLALPVTSSTALGPRKGAPNAAKGLQDAEHPRDHAGHMPHALISAAAEVREAATALSKVKTEADRFQNAGLSLDVIAEKGLQRLGHSLPPPTSASLPSPTASLPPTSSTSLELASTALATTPRLRSPAETADAALVASFAAGDAPLAALADDALGAKAVVVQQQLRRAESALVTARNRLSALVSSKHKWLPPALATAWRERGISREEEAYLRARMLPLTPETRLRRDLARAFGWSVVTLPLDFWIGLPSDTLRAAYLASLLPQQLRLRRPNAA